MNLSCMDYSLRSQLQLLLFTTLPFFTMSQATATPDHRNSLPKQEKQFCEHYLQGTDTKAAQKVLLELYNVNSCAEFESILRTPTGRDIWVPARFSGRDIQSLAPMEMVTFHNSVDLSHNRIKSLAASHGSFDGVPELNISNNEITSLEGIFSQRIPQGQQDAIDRPLVIADFNHIQRPTATTHLQQQVTLSMAGNKSSRGSRYDLVLSAPALLYSALRNRDTQALEKHISPHARTILGESGGTPIEIARNLQDAFTLRERAVFSINPQSLWYADSGASIEFTADGREFYSVRESSPAAIPSQPTISRWVDRQVQIRGTLASDGSLLDLQITPVPAQIKNPVSVSTNDVAVPLALAVRMWTPSLSRLPTHSGLDMRDILIDATPSGRFAKIEDHSSDGPWGRSLTLKELVAAERSGWTISSQYDWYGTGTTCSCDSHAECISAGKSNCGYERRQQTTVDANG
jgi:hypothetical protein